MRIIAAILLLSSLSFAQGGGGKVGFGGKAGFGGGLLPTISFVQSCGNNPQSGATTNSVVVSTVNCTFNVTTGDLLVRVDVSSSGSSPVCTDTLGNSWTAVSTGGTGSGSLTACDSKTTNGGADTVTLTTSFNYEPTQFVVQLRGVLSATPDAVMVSNSPASSTSWTGPAITTVSANDVVIAWGGNNTANNTPTAGSGWTIPTGSCNTGTTSACGQASGGNQSGVVEYQLVSTAQAYTPTLTWGTAMTGGFGAIAFH